MSEKRNSPWSYLRPYRSRVLGGIAFLLLTNLLYIVVPTLLQRIVDAFRNSADAGHIRTLAIWMIATAIATAVARIFSRVLLFNTGRIAEYDLRQDLFEHLLSFDRSNMEKHKVGDIMSRCTNDVSTVRALWGPGILNLVNTPLAFGSALIPMLVMDWQLTLYAIIPYISMVAIGKAYSRRIYAYSRGAQEQLGNVSDMLQEDLSNVPLIKTYSLEESRLDTFEEKSTRLLYANMKMTIIRGQLGPILAAIASVGILIVLWVGGRRVIADEMSLGELVAFNAFLGRLVWPTLALGWMLSLLQRGRSAWDRLYQLLSAEPVIQDGKSPALRADVPHKIELKNFSVSLGNTPILKNLNATFPAGSVTAIVGRTGSGKSTLAQALPRLIDIPKNQIFISGNDITDLPLENLRALIGFAPQETFLFSESIANNVLFGVTQEKDATSFMEAAGLQNDLAALPDGPNTLVGEKGITLSGGQRQRVALARALAVEPPILILDDSLSSVDAETEQTILHGLDRQMAGKTVVLISHRVAAVKRAHQILVLDQGEIVECGNHQELLAQNGVYAQVYNSQFDPEAINVPA